MPLDPDPELDPPEVPDVVAAAGALGEALLPEPSDALPPPDPEPDDASVPADSLLGFAVPPVLVVRLSVR